MEETQITPLEGDIVYQQDKAVIDTQIATAKQYPRSIAKAIENATITATLDKETAQSCHYSLPRGGKQISGPSVHLAKILLQSWGNIRAEARVTEVASRHVTSQAICFDLENNVAVKVEVKRSIITKTGRMNDDMITVTGNAANSIALRNAIFAVIPKSVTDKVYSSAKRAIAGDLSSKEKLVAKRKAVIDALKESYGVTEEEILRAIGKQSVNHIEEEEILSLLGIGQAIKDGDTTVDDAFRSRVSKEARSAADKERDRVLDYIKGCKTAPDLSSVEDYVKDLPKGDEIAKEYYKRLEALEGSTS